MKTKSIFTRRFSLFPCAAAAVLIPSVSFAGDYTWDGGFDGSWIIGTNWVGNPNGSGAPTHGIGSTQTFYASGAANLTTFLGAGRNVGTLIFNADADSDVSVRFATTSTGTAVASLTMDVLTGNAGISVDSLAAGNFILGVAAGSMLLNDNLVITHNGTGNLTINRPISDGTTSAAVTKDGSGALTLSNINNFTGGLTLNAGTLNINNLYALGGTTGTPGAVTINGGTIDNTSAAGITLSDKPNPFSINGNFAFGGTKNLNLGVGAVNFGTSAGTSRTITTNAGTLTIGGVISDGTTANSLIKAGVGTLVLGGANTYSGVTTISGGTLSLTNALALQNSVLDTSGSIAGSGSAGLKTNTTALTFGGLTGSRDMVGVFTTASGGYSSVTALTLNPGSGVSNSYSGIIANGASGMTLTKTGAGTQILTGASTYSGSTSIKAGTLIVGDGTSGSLASASVTVGGNDSSGTPTLGGRGTIAGATTISSAGTGVVGIHSPGVIGANGGVGIQTFSNSLTYQAGSIFQWDLKTGATGTAGTDFDAVAVDTTNGSLTVNNNSTTGSVFKVVLGELFNGGNAFWSDPAQKSWDVFAATNDATLGSNVFSRFLLFDTTSATVPVDFSSFGSFGFTNNGTTGTLTWTAVPEPTSALAGILLGAGLLRRRR